MCPRPRSIIPGSKARASSIGASRLTRRAPSAARRCRIRAGDRCRASPRWRRGRRRRPPRRRASRPRRAQPGPLGAPSGRRLAAPPRAPPTPRPCGRSGRAPRREPRAPGRSPGRGPPWPPSAVLCVPASSIPARKLAAAASKDSRSQSAKGHKMFVFHEQTAGRSSTLPPFHITETPNPARWRRCGNGGTTFSGLTRLVQAGAQAPFAPARQLTP